MIRTDITLGSDLNRNCVGQSGGIAVIFFGKAKERENLQTINK